MKTKTIAYKGISVAYDDMGDGNCLVLLHGYLETKEIWNSFAGKLSERCRVICPDIPGHGRSGIWGELHDMNDLAGAVKAVIEEEGLERVLLAGHSMGGYAVMAFAELYPELLAGYALLHSTCFADTEEKKMNRDREISLVNCGKKRQIVNVNIPKGFAAMNLDRLQDEVKTIKKLALGNPDDGIVALLNGMKARPDRTEVLKDPSLPLLLTGGMHDNYIPLEVFDKLVSIASHATVLRLGKSGHMGFIEEPGAVLETVLAMVENVF